MKKQNQAPSPGNVKKVDKMVLMTQIHDIQRSINSESTEVRSAVENNKIPLKFLIRTRSAEFMDYPKKI